ncbi:MAG TPA: alpha/beta fold hydrolase [Intrasporangium sp.]|uniref:alpha/beta fold hydrolase n=1 Tax=Intrasporangium sp. TaxID=1925024 RepID=UPI002D794BE8|nr:alpha/beta fold hydrolase [Intrasporangium sp.]HET7397152.1 alpha/beta fold hydrolase [Intrasporangium sp.]
MPQSHRPEARPRPLVLLHGLGQSPIAWQDFVSALGAGRPMHAPWLKGLLPKDAAGFDLEEAASGVGDELELQGIRRADVLGVSLGGSVALRLAVTRPELVERLVLAGALVRSSRSALRMQRLALRLVPERKLLDAGVSRARMLAAFDALATLDASGSLRQVAAPTLVVAGSRDRAGLQAARQLATDIPDARLEVVDGAGSLLNTDAPGVLADLTRSFLDS